MKKIILIKFGGSVMVPDMPDAEYIKKFKEFVYDLNGNYRFILITGGGGINKKYNDIATNVEEDVDNEDLDWIGIYATRLNARLLVSVFGKKCYNKVLTDPTEDIDWKEDILVAAGWKPGWSTDYVSMILGDKFNADKILIATNTDYIYNKDPNRFKDVEIIKEMDWNRIKKMVGDKWIPRMHIPLDPSAIRYGEEKKMEAISLNGRDLENMKKVIIGEDFKGTVIK